MRMTGEDSQPTSLRECSSRYCLLGWFSISCRTKGRNLGRLPTLTLPAQSHAPPTNTFILSPSHVFFWCFCCCFGGGKREREMYIYMYLYACMCPGTCTYASTELLFHENSITAIHYFYYKGAGVHMRAQA